MERVENWYREIKMDNERLDYIDFVKGIAIIAVTIGHVVGSYTFGYSRHSFYVYSCELPAFFW